MTVVAGGRFFASTGGWATFLTLLVTACALAGYGWRLFQKIDRVAETPDKVDQVVQRLDTIAQQGDDWRRECAERLERHEREHHGRRRYGAP